MGYMMSASHVIYIMTSRGLYNDVTTSYSSSAMYRGPEREYTRCYVVVGFIVLLVQVSFLGLPLKYDSFSILSIYPTI